VEFTFRRHTNYLPAANSSSRLGSIGEEVKEGDNVTTSTNKPKSQDGEDEKDDDEGYEEATSEIQFSVAVTTDPYGEFFPMIYFTATTDNEHAGSFYADIQKAQTEAQRVLQEREDAKTNTKNTKNNKNNKNNKKNSKEKEEEDDIILENAIKFEDTVHTTDFQFHPEMLDHLMSSLNLGNTLDESGMVYLLLAFPFHEQEWDLEDRICDLLFGVDDEGDGFEGEGDQ